MKQKDNIIFAVLLGIAFILMVTLLVLIYFETHKAGGPVYHGDSEDGTFSTSFIRASHSEAKGKNYMISPYSVEIALSMLRDGSAGDTADEIAKVAPQRTIKTLSVNKKVNVANALFVRDTYKNDVRAPYTDLLKTEYGAEFIYDAFKTPEKINNWVKKETNGMIEKILNDMDPDFVVGIANAVAMEEDWKSPFLCDNTYGQEFTVEIGKKMKVAMMHREFETGAYYYKDDDAEVAVLPYKMYDHETGKEVEKDGEQLEFIGILPKDIDSYVAKLTLDTIEKIDQEKKEAGEDFDLYVSLPRFEYSYDFKQFKSTLINMGIQTVFTPDADLSTMLDNHPDSYVSEAIHKSYVKVNEKGTKAAAVTYFGVKDNAIEVDEKDHKAIAFDKPFIFIIKDTKTNEILFYGVVYEPEKWNGKGCEE